MVRTPCCDQTGLRKGTWTPEEDSKLKAYISRHGCWNWRQLPKFAGLSRCGKSCRLRWMNYLRPNIKRGNFSKEEQEIIINLHQSLGNRWSAIAAQLPGRTDNEIKNHWHTYLKKRSGQSSISSQKENTRSSKRSNGVRRREKRSGVDNSSTSQQIFESSVFSPPPSSVESCLSMMDTAAANGRSFVAESDVFPLEMFDETTGSFGGQPFFPDNYDGTHDVLERFLDAGVWSPYSRITGEEFLCSYGLYDDYNNNVLEYW